MDSEKISKIPINKIDHVQVILVCGYKRHGKTTFSNDLLKEKLSKWVKVDYYGKSGNIVNLFDRNVDKQEGKIIINVAFADLGKEEVHKMLGLEQDYPGTFSVVRQGVKMVIKESSFYQIPYLYQQIKRRLKFHFPLFDENNTLRDCYNLIGQRRKKKFGKNYWAKTLVKKYSKYLNPDFLNVLIISDLRFKEELAYIRQTFANITTVRIIDPKKPIPGNIDIERQLDHLKTDYLFVPKMSFVDVEKTTEDLKVIFSTSI